MYISLIIFFIIGVIFGYFFNNIGYRLSIKESLFEESKCDKCNHPLSIKEKIPIVSFIIQKGKCNYCHQKISPIYIIFEIVTGLLFSLTYITFVDFNNSGLQILLSLVFISSLIIIMFGDIKYMLIPNNLLIVSSIVVIILKLFLGYRNEEILSLIDAGYELLFMLIDAAIMFIIMYVIKKIGDLIFKKESLGGGDIKMMAFVALIMGYKMSIIIIFIASFIALPFSIYNAYKKSEIMLPFGPYLAIATIILYLFNINFDTILEFIH
ncbi:MAG: prepilin peptidase [Bacilli bacterium]|nr:prepilin peptidase [Bacilli bacterium]